MWKTIYSIDLNLLIGIIGGIISGIFVSYVFLIEAEYRNQFNHVKEMFTCIYGITATYLPSLFLRQAPDKIFHPFLHMGCQAFQMLSYS